ncbi:MAG TPA: PAS domain-containing protein, partial [Trichocoleus sp.]
MNDFRDPIHLQLEDGSELRQHALELERSNHQHQQQIEQLQQQLAQERAARQQAEERLQLTLFSAQTVAWDMDLVASWVSCSPNALAMWGLQEGPSEDFFALIHPDDRQQIREAAQRALAGELAYSQEYRVIGPDGATRWI